MIIDLWALILIITTCKTTKDWNLQILENNAHCTWQPLSKIERTKDNTKTFHLDLKIEHKIWQKEKTHQKVKLLNSLQLQALENPWIISLFHIVHLYTISSPNQPKTLRIHVATKTIYGNLIWIFHLKPLIEQLKLPSPYKSQMQDEILKIKKFPIPNSNAPKNDDNY